VRELALKHLFRISAGIGVFVIALFAATVAPPAGAADKVFR
jgi:hypothetical protein